MKARYIRISTPDQKLERQLIKQHPDEKLFIDIISGSVPFKERPEGIKLLNDKEVKYITVHAIDRLGRNLIDILTTLQHFDDNGIKLKVENLGIESLVDGKPNPAFKLIISVLANIAEMERNTMLERQREGIEIAKAKGLYKGRVRGSVESKEEVLAKYPNVIRRLKEGQSLRNTAKLCDVSLGTVQKVKDCLQKVSI
ncbi:DNA invertase Pin-like site-specific DNA recombinase [Maribacter spongiicola]|uniref:DNA invertase Pin-like site-specific DNA recombinase n=1 Tax=Maribacter spongiicola TaxID=1206753 RepID=A0A4V3EQH9_9FLAO|nr:recombinase family protein [Maribacter spongiicola]TDT41968.1 DNA invertase Pin-like site-specific DNA recombinase [Maribacter spongiicola]